MGLCERCKKKQATFHMTNIDASGAKQERHLCEHCAVEEGHMQVAKPSVDINDLLETFLASTKSAAGQAVNLTCENCGISYIEFRNQGLLGCPDDYDAFAEPLGRLLSEAHGDPAHHVGKTPKSLGAQRKSHQDLRRLKRLLAEAVAAEDYERAAELRDQIRELESA
jgi:protein arginine kinase activator